MLNSKNPTIAIVDSGIGGTSILRQLIDKYNAGNYIYFADNLFMPYGDKTREWIRERMDYIINLLQSRYLVDFVIIACNTASCNMNCNVYKNVKTMQFDANKTYLATPLTKKSLPNINVIADESLASEIEYNVHNIKQIDDIIKQHIGLHGLNKLKTFVLGCTHYELFKTTFEKYCPKTEIISNSSFLIDKLNFNMQNDELNIIVINSKQSDRLRSTILDLVLN